MHGLAFTNRLSTRRLTSGANGYELVWKLVDDILNTCSDRLLLCFAFISNSVTNFTTLASDFAALCLCQQWLYLTCFLFGIQLNTMHEYKIWNVYFCKFPLLQYWQIFLKSVNNTQNNHKNKKGARFFETQCSTYFIISGTNAYTAWFASIQWHI